MAFGPPPAGLHATVDHDGVEVWNLRINEWEIRVGRDVIIGLPELLGCSVADSTRSPGRYALILKTAERTHRIGVGRKPTHLVWIAEAIREAERTRARREGTAGREYLFERVVPDEVRDLIER